MKVWRKMDLDRSIAHRSVIHRRDLQLRRPQEICSGHGVIVAIANKMARTIWAMLAHGKWNERLPPTVKATKRGGFLRR